jgi:hypothetical protein
MPTIPAMSLLTGTGDRWASLNGWRRPGSRPDHRHTRSLDQVWDALPTLVVAVDVHGSVTVGAPTRAVLGLPPSDLIDLKQLQRALHLWRADPGPVAAGRLTDAHELLSGALAGVDGALETTPWPGRPGDDRGLRPFGRVLLIARALRCGSSAAQSRSRWLQRSSGSNRPTTGGSAEPRAALTTGAPGLPSPTGVGE